MSAEALALLVTLFLTLPPSHNVVAARELARETMTKAGCAEICVAMERQGIHDAWTVRAWCKRLGPPEPQENQDLCRSATKGGGKP